MQVPDKNCDLCPRLHEFIAANRQKFPDKFNAPVPSFGDLGAELLIVGLAPGLKGANFSGRPFTGDYAGDLLYPTLLKFGLARGEYGANPNDGLELVNTRITNAVRCVPPENKPTTQEINTCRIFLKDEISAMKNLKVILSLGLISHNAVLKTFGAKISAHKFGHGAQHTLQKLSSRAQSWDRVTKKTDPSTLVANAPSAQDDTVILIDSYHCSRYNTNTGRLTTEMFEDVFEKIKHHLSAD